MGSHTWTAAKTGEYIACFSNEFSTFSHKLVYIDFQVGDEDPLPGMEGAVEPLTQMETSAREVHENLNERTMIWSVFVTFAIMCVGFGQVFVLKSFFVEKRPSQMYGAH